MLSGYSCIPVYNLAVVQYTRTTAYCGPSQRSFVVSSFDADKVTKIYLHKKATLQLRHIIYNNGYIIYDNDKLELIKGN